METKECSKCKVTFTLDQFYEKASVKCGYRNPCKTCTNIQGKKWRDANKEHHLALNKKWRDANKEHHSALSKKWSMENKDRKSATTKKWYIENKDRKSATTSLWRVKNQDHIVLTNKKYYEKNKEKCGEASKKWKKENREQKSETDRKWNEKNKERKSETRKKWTEENKDKVCSYSSKRRTLKLQACPPWLTKDDEMNIEGLYSKARQMYLDTGIPHHVDHSIPLIHPLVCGFHCFSNLRVITAKENLIKGNKFTPFVESDLDTTINLNTGN